MLLRNDEPFLELPLHLIAMVILSFLKILKQGLYRGIDHGVLQELKDLLELQRFFYFLEHCKHLLHHTQQVQVPSIEDLLLVHLGESGSESS